ncbi:MAG: toxin-antitoxin system HicB family antitoxin [Breznakibacter sp.]|nr:toxin-antitoxin system HicB family antitoxin [Breznakibacter sp.]
MKDVLTYKGFVGSVQFLSKEDKFVGKITGVESDVTFEGNSHGSLLESFHQAVDNYIVKTEAQYNGKLNCPISEELHNKLTLEANDRGISLNQYIIEILSKS